MAITNEKLLGEVGLAQLIKNIKGAIDAVKEDVLGKDHFLKNVNYNGTTNELEFTWNLEVENGEEKFTTKKIPLTGLIDTYVFDSSFSTSAGSGTTGKGQSVSLAKASGTVLGGIKTGFTLDTTGKNYPVVVDESGNAYVNVPWQNTQNANTWRPVKAGATTLSDSTTTLEVVGGTNISVELTAAGALTINNTYTYTHPTNGKVTDNGFVKVTVDNLGHVTGTAAVALADLTALGAYDASKLAGDISSALNGYVKGSGTSGLAVWTTDGLSSAAQITQAQHPVAGSGTVSSATAADTNLAWEAAVVTGVTRDANGHITAVNTTKLPKQPTFTSNSYSLGTGDEEGEVKLTGTDKTTSAKVNGWDDLVERIEAIEAALSKIMAAADIESSWAANFK